MVLVLFLINCALLVSLCQDLPERLELDADTLKRDSLWSQLEINLSEVDEVRTEWVPFGTSNLRIVSDDGQSINVPLILSTADLRFMLGREMKRVRPTLILGLAEQRALGLRE